MHCVAILVLVVKFDWFQIFTELHALTQAACSYALLLHVKVHDRSICSGQI